MFFPSKLTSLGFLPIRYVNKLKIGRDQASDAEEHSPAVFRNLDHAIIFQLHERFIVRANLCRKISYRHLH